MTSVLGIYIIVGGPPCQPFSQANKRGLGQYDVRNGIDAFLNIVKISVRGVNFKVNG